MSPASGDVSGGSTLCRRALWQRFHSINVPSEWGRTDQQVATLAESNSFHSINVPSEWGPPKLQQLEALLNEVSIQLMSPASGD